MSLPQPQRLAPGLWRLGGHHIPAFLIRSQGQAALFEVGISQGARLVLEQLDWLGVAREEVGWLILSHAHSDHATGQQALLRGLPRAVLLMSPASRRHLAKSGTLEQFAEEDVFTGREIARREGFGSAPEPVTSLLPGRVETVELGQALAVGDLSLEFLAGRGHAPGALLAWLPQAGAILASDSAGFLVEGRPQFPLFFVSYAQYQETVARLRSLGARVLAPGHQQSLQGEAVDRYLAALAADMEEFREQVRRRIQSRSQQEVAQEIFTRYYEKELAIYPPESIRECCRILVRRSLED